MEIEIKRKKFNWPLVGNRNIVNFLSKSFVNDRISSSYIFSGPNGLGKTTVARRFAQILLCEKREEGRRLPCGQCPSCRHFSDLFQVDPDKDNIAHGDFHLIKKETGKKNISIEQIRDFINIISMSSFLGGYKIGIIKHAEALSLEAANSLLKTLEEPRQRVVIILVTSNPDLLPKTIISRSQKLEFYPVNFEIIYDFLIKDCGASRSQAKNFARLCQGRPALAAKFLEDKDFYGNHLNKAGVFLDFFHQDLNQRIEKVSEIFGRNFFSQGAVDLAQNIISTWQGVCRDLLLINFGHQNLIQHQPIEEKFIRLKGKIKTVKILEIFNNLDKSRAFLKNNVNPGLVLEQIAVNI